MIDDGIARPKGLRIGAKYFILRWSQEQWDRLQLSGHLDDHDKSVGFSDSETGDIFIKPGQSLGEEQDTLIHEILHMIWSQVPDAPEMDEEFIVAGFSPWLLLVLQDNPNLIPYIQTRREL